MKTVLSKSAGWPSVKKPVFKITSDPLPEVLPHKSKYQETFEKLKPGQCLVVPKDEMAKVTKALRKFCVKKPLKVVTCVNYDENGRIWLMDK